MSVEMFDKNKGQCKYCYKETRSSATSLCSACYKLQVAIKNNVMAAQKMIAEFRVNSNLNYSKPYEGTQPKETQ